MRFFIMKKAGFKARGASQLQGLFRLYASKTKHLTLLLTTLACASCFLFPSSDTPPPSPPEPEADSVEPPPWPCGPIDESSLSALQFEETPSTEKISLIERFSRLEGEELQTCLQTRTPKELIGLTVLDLSRHTHTPLAEKSKDLADLFDLETYVEYELRSRDEERRSHVAAFLARIEPERAEETLEAASIETNEERELLKQEVAKIGSKVLIPTESEQGDRYYVQADWDTENPDQIKCLTELFHKELASQRSLPQEAEKMKESNGRRWVYWYSKHWALFIAESIKKCGAEAAFVADPEADLGTSNQQETDASATETGRTAATIETASVEITDGFCTDEQIRKLLKFKKNEDWQRTGEYSYRNVHNPGWTAYLSTETDYERQTVQTLCGYNVN